MFKIEATFLNSCNGLQSLMVLWAFVFFMGFFFLFWIIWWSHLSYFLCKKFSICPSYQDGFDHVIVFIDNFFLLRSHANDSFKLLWQEMCNRTSQVPIWLYARNSLTELRCGQELSYSCFYFCLSVLPFFLK